VPGPDHLARVLLQFIHRQQSRIAKRSMTMDALELTSPNDFANDASLLEGLYQLVVNGHTDGWEFQQLNSEVYDRLMHTYPVNH
jgi:hypothetical protein